MAVDEFNISTNGLINNVRKIRDISLMINNVTTFQLLINGQEHGIKRGKYQAVNTNMILVMIWWLIKNMKREICKISVGKVFDFSIMYTDVITFQLLSYCPVEIENRSQKNSWRSSEYDFKIRKMIN